MMAGRWCLTARFWALGTIFHLLPKRKFTVGQKSFHSGGFETLSRLTGKACCGTSQASSGAHHFSDGMSQTGLQESDYTRKKSKQAVSFNYRFKPTWVASHLAMWDSRVDAGMRRHPRSISSSRKVASSRFSVREGDLEVGPYRKLCENGDISEAIDALNLLVQQGFHVPNNLFYLVLKRCIIRKDLVLGSRIHALTVESGFEGDNFLATHLIGLYAAHGRLEEAMRLFSKVSKPDAYNWASIILAHARHGEPTQALRLYWQMRESTVEPDNCVFVAVLKACASAGDLATGKDVHAHILASASFPDMLVQNCLVDMYGKCGSVQDAQKVFDSISKKTVVTWTSMIAGYIQQGMGQEALTLYRRMQEEGITRPNSVTFVCLLQACAGVGVTALDEGKRLHATIEEQSLQSDVVLGNSLVNMYAKCGSLVAARRVFDSLPLRDVVTWNSMITGYAQQGMGREALGLYSSLQQEARTQSNSVTFVSLLQACSCVGVEALHEGKQLHAEIEQRGLLGDAVVGNSLINMYAKCGNLQDAQHVFENSPKKNVVTWTAMMAGYVNQGLCQEALGLYSRMKQESLTQPNSVTFVCLLQACAGIGIAALDQGKQLQAQIEAQGLQADVVVGGSLVNMYAKCGHLEDAQRVFDNLSLKNVVTWNAMIAGFAQQGIGQEALGLYSSMKQEGINPPDSATFVCLLQACGGLGEAALDQGRQLHAEIEERGLQVDVGVGGSLVTMYAQCGSLENARRVFDGLSQKNVVTWNAIITAYVQQGMSREALNLYSIMKQEGINQPDSVTFLCLLLACSKVAALPLGKQLHAQIEELGLQADVAVSSSLVHMYAKCGSMVDSQQVFDSLPERCVVAWNALIAGYAQQGDAETVFDLVHTMRQEGIHPDGITFLRVLSVCSYVGLVDEGRTYFKAMSRDHGITPTIEHYICMMDLLGRSGHLDEALLMVKAMPIQPTGAAWRTLLGACQKWSNVEVGRQAFESAVRLDEKDAAAYVLMANIYTSAQMWGEAKKMQARRMKYGACKQPGQSWWTDEAGVVHSFVAGGREHLDSEGLNSWSLIRTK